jgi:hypothetical protein
MDVPPDLNVPESIARVSPLSAEAMRTKRMEGISLLRRYMFWPSALEKKFTEFDNNWKKIEKDTLARRLALYSVGKEYGLPMVEHVQYYEFYLGHDPRKSNPDGYLDGLSQRGYFPEGEAERMGVRSAHQGYKQSLTLYRAKLGLPEDFAPHLRSWRLTDVPPDLIIPDVFRYGTPLPGLRHTKRNERISLELDCLFQKTKRREKLREFKANWANVEKDVLAMRLALNDVQEKYDPAMIPNVRYYHALLRRNRITESLLMELKHDYIQTVFFPQKPEEKVKVYDAYELYRMSFDHYKARLGLPKEYVPHYVLKTTRQRTD